MSVNTNKTPSAFLRFKSYHRKKQIPSKPFGLLGNLSMGYKKDIFAGFAYEFEPLHKK